MWPFTSPQTQEPASAPPIDREATLLAELHEIDWHLAALDVEIRHFRQKHSLKTDKFNRILGMQTAGLTDVAGLQTEWKALLKRSDQLFFRRNDVLRQWSAAKMEAKCQPANQLQS
jgi:hypothetical protein